MTVLTVTLMTTMSLHHLWAQLPATRIFPKGSTIPFTFYNDHAIPLMLDSDAETHVTLAHHIGLPVSKSSQRAYQADGVTTMDVGGETCYSQQG